MHLLCYSELETQPDTPHMSAQGSNRAARCTYIDTNADFHEEKCIKRLKKLATHKETHLKHSPPNNHETKCRSHGAPAEYHLGRAKLTPGPLDAL